MENASVHRLGGMRRMAVERRRKHRGIFEANKKEAQQLGTGDWCRQVDIKRRADREWLESAAEMKTENAGVTHTHQDKRRNKCHTLMQPTICDGINDGSNNNDLDGHLHLLFFFIFGCFIFTFKNVLIRLIVPFVTPGTCQCFLWPSSSFVSTFLHRPGDA